jgi:hypothetical protein
VPTTDWLSVFDADRRNLRLGSPASEAELTALEAKLGHRLPGDLRSLLAVANGFEDLGGQWQCAWDTERIGIQNERLRLTGVFDAARLAFGDNGAGDPFCVLLAGESAGQIDEWSPIELQSIRSWPNLLTFWTDWLNG